MNESSSGSARGLRTFTHVGNPSARIVCFPHAGGSASYFFPLAKLMPADVELNAVQYPGRQDRRHEPFEDNLARMADRICGELEPASGVPVALLGHSMGALLAFEVCLRLEAGGHQVRRLWASAAPAPSLHVAERLHLVADEDLVALLQRLDGTSTELLSDPDILAMVLPAFRHDLKAIETHGYPVPDLVDAPITALIGDQDATVTPDRVAGWRSSTRAEFDLISFSGGHFYLGQAFPRVARLLIDDMAPAGEGEAA